jgi:hypothetical protein
VTNERIAQVGRGLAVDHDGPLTEPDRHEWGYRRRQQRREVPVWATRSRL